MMAAFRRELVFCVRTASEMPAEGGGQAVAQVWLLVGAAFSHGFSHTRIVVCIGEVIWRAPMRANKCKIP